MFGLFDDMFNDYYQPKRQIRAPRRQQQTESDLYDQLLRGFTQNQQDLEETKQQSQQKRRDLEKVIPKSTKVTINQKQQSQKPTFQEKPKHIQTPPRNAHEPSDDARITNREFIDPPEVAFKTYRPSNVLITVPQIVKPLDSLSKTHLTTEQTKAVVRLSNEEVQENVEIQVTGNGKLNILFGEQRLQYELPAFYERSEIRARRVETGIEITIPICDNQSDDIMLVQIE
uniref:Hsp20/alpha crystallin family protein n=1 Tax=Trepomonas sp. PC1 TaxID=1076344 RepID=A0A146KAH8_9EUKA|eukprot:JAP93567.1 Hsp20/alpha crystallin family protein [Trepomonas sp. PC1]